MEIFTSYWASVMQVFQAPFTIYGYEVSWFQVFVWVAVAEIIMWVIYNLLGR